MGTLIFLLTVLPVPVAAISNQDGPWDNPDFNDPCSRPTYCWKKLTVTNKGSPSTPDGSNNPSIGKSVQLVVVDGGMPDCRVGMSSALTVHAIGQIAVKAM